MLRVCTRRGVTVTLRGVNLLGGAPVTLRGGTLGGAPITLCAGTVGGATGALRGGTHGGVTGTLHDYKRVSDSCWRAWFKGVCSRGKRGSWASMCDGLDKVIDSGCAF